MSINARLAACDDRDIPALCDEIRSILRAQDVDANEREVNVVLVLEYLASRQQSVRFSVAKTLLADDSPDSFASFSAVLGGILQQEKKQDEGTVDVSLLVGFATRVETELTRSEMPPPPVMRTLISWADTLADLAVTTSMDEEDHEAAWVSQIVRAFVSIHRHAPTNRADFRVMTLVWKNVNKLSSVHRAPLAQTIASDDFSISSVFDAVATSVAETAQRLRLLAHTANDREDDEDGVNARNVAQELKLLRLFLRAFQGQFINFVDVLVAQVECGVALVVDAIAAVIPFTGGRAVASSDKNEHEAMRVLLCAITFLESAAKSDALQASTRSFAASQLWQDTDKMQELVQQTRSQYVDGVESSSKAVDAVHLEWAHVLALSAFFAIQGPIDTIHVATAEQSTAFSSESPLFACVAALLVRYRVWARHVRLSAFSKTIELFIDVLLDALVTHTPSAHALQLFLLEQTLLPVDTAQRLVLSELWRELLCFVWAEEPVATDAFQFLLSLASARHVASDARAKILQLVALLYPELPGALQHVYLCRISEAFDTLCSEGPAHPYTPELATSLDLLSLLAPTSLLSDYRLTDKEDWAAHYLPNALECVGGVHDMLERLATVLPAERDGIARLLDTGLLFVLAIFDDDGGATDDDPARQGLAAMLLTVCTETLTRAITKLLGSPASSFVVRIVEHCLAILLRVAPRLKTNTNNQCVLVLRDLLVLLQSDHVLGATGVAIAIFLRDALSDLNVSALSDVDVVVTLFERLFHKLSALSFGLASTVRSPPQSLCLDAFYTVLARSSLATQRPVKPWLVAHAHNSFSGFLQAKCNRRIYHQEDAIIWPGSDVQGSMDKRDDEAIRRRFPKLVARDQSVRQDDQLHQDTEQSEPMEEAHDISRPEPVEEAHETNDPFSVHAIDVDEPMDEADPSPSMEVQRFISLYQRLHNRMDASPESQHAFLTSTSLDNLEQASNALMRLLQ